jgi:type I restriction enzyme S subunit
VNEAVRTLSAVPPRRSKRYPAYKDSAVEWLGDIPAHWEVTKLAWLTHCLDGRRVPLNAEERGAMQGDFPYWGANSIVDHVDQWLFDEELVLLGEDGAPFFDRTKPVAFHVSGKIWVNNHAHVLRPKSAVDATFLAHALNCVDYRVFIDGTTRDKLTQGDMNAIPLQLPPIREQRAIAAFLDWETTRIDALVAKKEQLIELLQEKRTALITRAVTKGLDPTVPMKDSGVEWLGEIPAHWEVKRIKWAAQMVSGHTPDKKIDSYWQGGDIPWVSLADTAQLREVDYIATTAVMTTSDGIAHSSAHILPAGTVVFSRDATIGLCAITRGGMAVSQHFIGWVCGSHLQPEYLLFVLRSMTQELERLTMGATVRTIGMPDVKSLVTPIPPFAEQEEIVREVLRRRERIDALILKVRDVIARLKELRTALISAAVTGKIDVRKESA